MTLATALCALHLQLRFAVRRAAWVGLVSVASACADEAIIRDFNDLPVARATVFNPATGATLDVAPDGGLAPVTFPYNGSPVRIVLDARSSSDPDGHITTYRWLSGTRTPDAGVPVRLVESGQPRDWPTDDAMPTVDLGPGLWTFMLWVRDNRNAWSVPDTIRVVIGSVGPARPSDAGTTALGLTGMDAGTRLPSNRADGDER